MDNIPIEGQVDSAHQLFAEVPESIPPGPVMIWLQPVSTEEDAAGAAWAAGVAREWADDLGDARQDIYTQEDGEALDEN